MKALIDVCRDASRTKEAGHSCSSRLERKLLPMDERIRPKAASDLSGP